ncbi:MAG: ribulose-phosphate 3-epimerase [Cellulosilyticaceae bacterium]
MIHLAPSILSADFANLERDVKKVEAAGATFLHVDVMDGQFVSNITIGAPVAKALRPHFEGVMDVHLMIASPERYLEDFAQAGADILTVHLEACTHIHGTLQRIRGLGMKAGVAINPGTPVSVLEPIMDQVDMVLVMSVNPGFGGQSFIPYSLEKIRQVKALADQSGREILIQVDGGIGLDNAKEVIEAGANVLVAGSAVYNAPDITARVQEFVTLFGAVAKEN